MSKTPDYNVGDVKKTQTWGRLLVWQKRVISRVRKRVKSAETCGSSMEVVREETDKKKKVRG